MKKYTLLLLPILIIFSLLYSCEEDELSNDKAAPVISEVKIGAKDTIIVVNEDGTREILYINTNSRPQIDTLILNKRVTFSARFADETPFGLSSYRVKIAYDSINQELPAQNDTTVYIVSRGFGEIFHKTDTTVVNQQITLPNDSVTYNNRFFKMKEGRYRFIISCTDKSGNEATDTLYTSILSRSTIIKNWKK